MGHAVSTGDRDVWREVLAVRHAHHREERITGTSREGRPAAPLSVWLAELGDALIVVEERTIGDDEGDPRAALVELMAVAAAWIDALDLRQTVRP